MGDAEEQGSLAKLIFFLDENHSGNRHLHSAFSAAGVHFTRHEDHFAPGTEDTVWIPVVAGRGWIVLTADARIRVNELERLAVRRNRLRLFYFSRNDFAGAEMGQILTRALPKMLALCTNQEPPFAASIERSGKVTIRPI